MSAQLRLLEEPPSRPPPGSSDEFFTPWILFSGWNKEFSFTLDVAATPESAKCRRFFSPADDGLRQSWRGERVWLNPPYSDITPWVTNAMREVTIGGCLLVVALLPAWTDRRWWVEYVEPFRDRARARAAFTLEVRFLGGRIAFGWPGRPEGNTRSRASFPSLLAIWRGR